MDERVTVTVTVGFAVQTKTGREATLSPQVVEVDLTDLFKMRSDRLARLMMPMRVTEAVQSKVSEMLTGIGIDL